MSNQGPGVPPGWKRSPSGHLFRQKNDGSWWWRASDQRWYPEAQHPSYRQPVAPPLPPPVAPPPVATHPGPLSVDRPTPVFDPGSARRRGRSAPPIPACAHALERPAPVSTAPLPQRGLDGVPRLADECAGRLVDHRRPRGDRCPGVAGRQDGGGVGAIHHCSDHAGDAHDHDRSPAAKGRDDDCSQTYADHSHAAGDDSARTGGDNDPGHGSAGN